MSKYPYSASTGKGPLTLCFHNACSQVLKVPPPFFQDIMRNLAANPEMAANIIGSNPLFAGNPELQQQMRNMMPAMMQQLNSPEMMSVVGNSEAMRAIMQIQDGLQRLR